MTQKSIIEAVKKFVQKSSQGEATGHDWWHNWRVWRMAKKIAQKEGGDLFIIELAALLHDIDDWKFAASDSKKGPQKARNLLESLNVDKKIINEICNIIDNVSFKGAGVKNKMKSREGRIVQDADRLDVIGAMGIARTFAYGGYKKREIYNPDIKPKFHQSFKAYKNAKSTSINHFYEKQLLLKDRLNTKTAKKIAGPRHKFLEDYLRQFFKEWKIRV